MMPLRAVFFDLDGTLLDTLEDIATSANAALRSQGLPPHPIEAYNKFVGEGARTLVEKMAKEANHAALLDAFKEHYQTNWYTTSKPYVGIQDLLEALTCKGVKVGILSNKPDAFVQACVAHFFPSIPFCSVAGEKEKIPRKPDPKGLLVALEALHVAPQEACYVGDTKTDMETAQRAKVLPLGVSWGFRDAEELRAYGARHIFDDAASLGGFLMEHT